MRTKMGLCVAAFAAVSGLAASVASATAVEWTNWTTGTNNFPGSVVVGTLPVSGTYVTYLGSALFR